jgi:hypothetical protein
LKLFIVFSTTLILVSCLGHGNSTNLNGSKNSHAKTDTIKYYWDPVFASDSFDTVVNKTAYHMKTFCLNDSAVYIETISAGKVEYNIAHNYKTDFVIKTENSKTINLSILKENFKDSLPTDFYKICHMWKNKYSHFDNGQLVFRATLAKPDTDYQMSVLYSISDKGEFKILKVEDESYNGDEEE